MLTRMIIWVYRPVQFTEIIYSYMPYAHLWAGGTQPYLQQWYEYPPATIPLFYIPHVIDMATNHHWYHLDYLVSYRGILLIIDVAIFALLNVVLKKFKASNQVWVGSLLYYSLVTAKANHFIYDSMDITFSAAILLSAVAPFLWKKRGPAIGWLGYFLATALKYVNAPLGLIYAAFERKSLKRLIAELVVTGLLVWGIPLSLYRSSLLVSFVYHQQRGLQVESAPATIARTINSFTKSERYAEVYKNYDIQGPASDVIKKIFDILFPISLFVYGVWAAVRAFYATDQQAPTLRLWMTLGYISLFMITAKVLSTPFLLWHIPLVAAIPTKTVREKLLLMLVSGIIILASMTTIPNLPIGIFSVHLLIGWIRVLGFSYLFGRSIQAIKST